METTLSRGRVSQRIHADGRAAWTSVTSPFSAGKARTCNVCHLQHSQHGDLRRPCAQRRDEQPASAPARRSWCRLPATVPRCRQRREKENHAPRAGRQADALGSRRRSWNGGLRGDGAEGRGDRSGARSQIRSATPIPGIAAQRKGTTAHSLETSPCPAPWLRSLAEDVLTEDRGSGGRTGGRQLGPREKPGSWDRRGPCWAPGAEASFSLLLSSLGQAAETQTSS